MHGLTNTQENEQLPVQVIDKILGEKSRVRVALAIHPVTKQVASCVPIIDLSEVFSYDKSALRKMVERTNWLKKHSSKVIMTSEGGGFRPHICIFEEAMLGIFLKLQPQRCKDPKVAERIEEIQEEMIKVLKDALKGYSTGKKEVETELVRYKLLSQKARDIVYIASKIECMKDGAYKNAAISVLEGLTGKKFPKPAQLDLDLK